jgi:hypothetical protein
MCHKRTKDRDRWSHLFIACGIDINWLQRAILDADFIKDEPGWSQFLDLLRSELIEKLERRGEEIKHFTRMIGAYPSKLSTAVNTLEFRRLLEEIDRIKARSTDDTIFVIYRNERRIGEVASELRAVVMKHGERLLNGVESRQRSLQASEWHYVELTELLTYSIVTGLVLAIITSILSVIGNIHRSFGISTFEGILSIVFAPLGGIMASIPLAIVFSLLAGLALVVWNICTRMRSYPLNRRWHEAQWSIDVLRRDIDDLGNYGDTELR